MNFFGSYSDIMNRNYLTKRNNWWKIIFSRDFQKSNSD